MDPLTVADGGLATTLQRHGLPELTPVDDWLADRPDQVEQVHRAFVEAGAQICVAGTFRTLPGIQPRWRELADIAVDLARAAAGDRARVWASIGPLGPLGSADEASREAWGALAAHLAPRVDGLLLETFGSLDDLVEAVRAVRQAAPDRPVVASATPAEDGRLLDGSEPDLAVDRLIEAGAIAVGFNCGTDPEAVARAVLRSNRSGLWARPAGEPGDPGALSRALEPIRSRCAVVGGCCNAGPEAIALLSAWEVTPG